MASQNSHKRRRVEDGLPPSLGRLTSMGRAISPPVPSADITNLVDLDDDANDPLKNVFRQTWEISKHNFIDLTVEESDGEGITGPGFNHGEPAIKTATPATLSGGSPFRLTKICDLPASENRDSIEIKDILGDVMLSEVWVFNYCHSIPWVMSQFDPDIVEHVKVTFVHGYWKKDDVRRIMMEVG
jgi:hypothetical protein